MISTTSLFHILSGKKERFMVRGKKWEMNGITWVTNQKQLSYFWEHAVTCTPPHHHLRRPSTNAQRSWTTSISGIILYEIDGWGQPLTERVKTTLRCPLWISMMENRLLKKIYVCSPLLPPLPPQPPNQTCHCGQIKLAGLYSAASFVTISSLSCKKTENTFLCIEACHLFLMGDVVGNYTVIKTHLIINIKQKKR